MSAASSPPGIRISLREFLILITVVVVACAALKFANEYWLIGFSLATLLAFMATTIVAVVDRGSRQAFATGFIVAGVTYGSLLYARNPASASSNFPTPNPEFDPYEGKLPTTRLLRPLFEFVTVTMYVDRSTGRRINQSELPPGAKIDTRGSGFGGMGGGMGGGGGMMVAAPKTGFGFAGQAPDREHFMPIAHCLWALLFGYAGGHFARWVYFRRLREQNAAAPVAAG